jgi:hypothetical protein
LTRILFPWVGDRLEALSHVISVNQRSSAVNFLRSLHLCVEIHLRQAREYALPTVVSAGKQIELQQRLPVAIMLTP